MSAWLISHTQHQYDFGRNKREAETTQEQQQQANIPTRNHCGCVTLYYYMLRRREKNPNEIKMSPRNHENLQYTHREQAEIQEGMKEKATNERKKKKPQLMHQKHQA